MLEWQTGLEVIDIAQMTMRHVVLLSKVIAAAAHSLKLSK